VLRGKDGSLPDLVHTHPNETIAEAVAIRREYGVSQMPVVNAEPPIMAAEAAGAVGERDLMERIFAGDAKLADTVEMQLGKPLPNIGASEPISEAVAELENADAVLVHEDGMPVGILTRHDLLGHLGTS